jgi:ABC-type phosphate/phosphonate transport system substrate-binding protein
MSYAEGIQRMKQPAYLLLLVALGLTAPLVARADVNTPHDSTVITLVAAPRGTEAEETAIYQPLAEYLGRRVGTPVRYVFMSDWLLYRKAVMDNSYDLYFNGPHFSAWLMDFRRHQLIARLAESHTFVVIARAGNARVKTVGDLGGRKNCLHAPPNLGTEIFASLFDNPARQPYTVPIKGWKSAFDGVVAGHCEGAILPDVVLSKLNTNNDVRIVHRTRTIANQAITASPRLSPATIDKLRSAILAPEANVAAAQILNVYASKGFVAANPADYAGISAFLKDDFLLGKEVSAAAKTAKP